MMCGMLLKVSCCGLTFRIDRHVGLRKKLEKLAKQKGCELVGEWQKSIINHLYWSVSSTADGDEDVIRAKWLSLDNHLHNKHRNHGTTHFRKCNHGRLGRRNRKKWFKRRKFETFFPLKLYILFNILDTKASEKLSALLTSNHLCNDMVKLSPKYQTSSVESSHNVIIHFVPKSVAFS